MKCFANHETNYKPYADAHEGEPITDELISSWRDQLIKNLRKDDIIPLFNIPAAKIPDIENGNYSISEAGPCYKDDEKKYIIFYFVIDIPDKEAPTLNLSGDVKEINASDTTGVTGPVAEETVKPVEDTIEK